MTEQPRDKVGRFGSLLRVEGRVFFGPTQYSFSDWKTTPFVSVEELMNYAAEMTISEEEEIAGHEAAGSVWCLSKREQYATNDFIAEHGPKPEITPPSKMPGAARTAHIESTKAAEDWEARKDDYVAKNINNFVRPDVTEIRNILRIGVLVEASKQLDEEDRKVVMDSMVFHQDKYWPVSTYDAGTLASTITVLAKKMLHRKREQQVYKEL